MQAPKPAVLLLLALPFTAGAGEKPSHGVGDSLVVEYEGTITAVFEAPPDLRVGDRISGRLLIDPRLASDVDPTENNSLYRSTSPAFVRGFWQSSGDGFDQVSIGNTKAKNSLDTFSVEDFLVGEGASLDGAKVFAISAGARGLFDDAGLHQSFELTRADLDTPDEQMSGGIRWSSLGPFPFVQFLVDKFKVSPGRCFAH